MPYRYKPRDHSSHSWRADIGLLIPGEIYDDPKLADDPDFQPVKPKAERRSKSKPAKTAKPAGTATKPTAEPTAETAVAKESK